MPFFAYATTYLIDTDHAIIVDVEATTAIRQAEVLPAKRACPPWAPIQRAAGSAGEMKLRRHFGRGAKCRVVEHGQKRLPPSTLKPGRSRRCPSPPPR